MDIDIYALRKFARKAKHLKWYAGFCSAFDSNPKKAYLYFRERPQILKQLEPITGYYPGKSGPCLRVPEMWVLRNPQIDNKCEVCGNPTRLRFQGKYAPTCSGKCGAKSCVDKRQATCLERYGSTNPSRVDSIKTKRRETFIERFGCENPFQAESVKVKILKAVQDRYGVDNPSQNEAVKSLKRATFRKNYGADHWTQNTEVFKASGLAFTEEMLNKASSTYYAKTGFKNPFQNPKVLEQVRATTIKNLGVDNPFKSKEVAAQLRKTWLSKYGVDNPWKAPEIKQKIYDTNMVRYGVRHPQVMPGVRHQFKQITDRFGVTHKVEGYEHEVIELFDKYRNVRKIVSSRKRVPSIPYKHKGKHHRYYPDLIVHTTTQKILVEVKSLYTLGRGFWTNISKFREAVKRCKAVGGEFLLVVGKNAEGRFLCIKNPTTKRDLIRAGLRFKGTECRFRR